MKLKKEFITHDLDGEQIMVSASGTFKGFLKSNKTAAFIINLLKEDTTEEDIVMQLLEKYNAPKEIVEKDVKKILDTLRKVGGLDE